GIKHLTTLRKSLMRELGVIGALFSVISLYVDVLHRFPPGWERGMKPEVLTARKHLHKFVMSITNQFMKVQLAVIKDHFANQSFVAGFLKTILSLVGKEPLAAELLSEMLSRNKGLQETRIGRREISLFVEQMKVLRMNSMYLELLRSCCSCEGRAVLK